MKYASGRLLKDVMRAALLARGVCPESTEHVVESLVQTSLRGVDSHGIQLFPHYCRAVDAGRINRRPSFSFDQAAPGAAILDADHAFGHHAGAVAMDHAVARAKEVGIAAVGVKNSTHFGAAAYFGLRAAAGGCLGFAFTNADALMKAHGARDAFIGTNPVCFTAPMEGEEPFCLDMATSLVTWNKVVMFRRLDQPIPGHWACGADGAPVRDAHAARTLQPAGEHKGYGMGMAVDILCSLLSGGPIGRDLLPMYESLHAQRLIGHFFMALDIRRFCPVGDFARRLTEMAERARHLVPVDPGVPVMVAGDPEKKAWTERTREGIPVDDLLFGELLQVSPEFARSLVA
jgi:LDH2 family malate/lactate/ureidoglycolate dehydrogenase